MEPLMQLLERERRLQTVLVACFRGHQLGGTRPRFFALNIAALLACEKAKWQAFADKASEDLVRSIAVNWKRAKPLGATRRMNEAIAESRLDKFEPGFTEQFFDPGLGPDGDRPSSRRLDGSGFNQFCLLFAPRRRRGRRKNAS
jgi:hypothetical protein